MIKESILYLETCTRDGILPRTYGERNLRWKFAICSHTAIATCGDLWRFMPSFDHMYNTLNTAQHVSTCLPTTVPKRIHSSHKSTGCPWINDVIWSVSSYSQNDNCDRVIDIWQNTFEFHGRRYTRLSQEVQWIMIPVNQIFCKYLHSKPQLPELSLED